MFIQIITVRLSTTTYICQLLELMNVYNGSINSIDLFSTSMCYTLHITISL